MKKLLKILLHRVVLVGIALVAQFAFLIVVLLCFDEYFSYFYFFSILLSVGIFLWIISNKSNPGYKIAWIVPILLFPIFGGVFYVLLGGNRLSPRMKRKMLDIGQKMESVLQQDQTIADELGKISRKSWLQSHYIYQYARCPLYQHTSVEYLPLGEVKFERMLEELKKAKHYIFLEYFIIQEGKMWDPILDILVEKVKEGVDVRLIYDDMGCIMTLPYGYNQKLNALGVKCRVFNPFIPILSSRFNNRDHRKICVIDGHTGFTGGINLADEYINAYPKHGHWKDVAVMLQGDAVWSLTVMFLTMWENIGQTNEDYNAYRPDCYQPQLTPTDGFVQPYSDSPLDDEAIGENVYMNIISKAERYVYLMTPYLIIDNEMVTCLSTAAKSGVDVRIITPHHPDKWYVHAVTKSYYESLVESGVKIYEYTPGFIHAKVCVSDDQYATVGTINLDYRSLYLHFECGVWCYRSKMVLDARDDYLETLKKCQPITLEDCRNTGPWRRLTRAILRTLAPLM